VSLRTFGPSPIDAGYPATSVIDAVTAMPHLDPLDRAAARVLQDQAGNHFLALDARAVERDLAGLVNGIRAALRGHTPQVDSAGVSARLGLLHMLRTALVRDWKEGDGNILPLLRAIEVTQDRLVAWGEDESHGETLHPFSRNILREVAHFLRSPLGSIVMLTDTLLEGRSGPLTDLQRKQLDIIHRAALGVAGVTGDILALVNEDERCLSPQRFHPDAILEATANVARPVASARGSELLARSGVSEHRVGPAVGLAQALLGLTLRAALSTRNGRVEIRAVPDGDLVRFSVVSVGAHDPEGRDPRDLLRIFRFDADTGSTSLSVDGLGMEAARAILQRMGAELSVESKPGEVNFTFAVSLPPSD
jgi:signal transduction histidine kinase